jgi:glycosyltransferase involved in cell wall biosynthesis
MSPETGWGRYSAGVISALDDCERHDYVPWTGLGDPMNFNAVRNPVNAYYLAKAVIKLRRMIEQEDVDAVLSLLSYPYSAAVYLGTRGGRSTPYFVCCHGTYAVAPLFQRGARQLAVRSFQHAEMLFPVSTFTAERIREAAPKLTNIMVAKNGIRPEIFGDAAPYELDHNTILTVGPFKQRKGQQLGVEVFAEITGKYPDIEYHLVGKKGGEYYEGTKQLVDQYGLSDRIHFEGFIPEESLHRWYASADVYLFPAQYIENHHFEGLGLVLLEANWYGAPAVGTKCSGAVDAISDGVTGFISDPEPAPLAGKMDLLLSDDSLRSRMSSDAKLWAQSHTWEETAEIIEREISNAV